MAKIVAHRTYVKGRRTAVGYTALHVANFRTRRPAGLATMRVLLDAEDCPVDQPDGHGRTALHYATSQGLLETCKLLIEYGANPNLADGDGSIHTTLRMSDAHSRRLVLEYYLSLPSVEVNIRNEAGDTPLMYAIKRLMKDAATMLVRCPRVDRRLTDADGKTAAELAEERWPATPSTRAFIRNVLRGE